MVLGISLFKPIFVNRYMIFVTVGLTILNVHGMITIRNTIVRICVVSGVVAGLLYYQTWIPVKIQKVDFRETFEMIQLTAQPDDLIVSASPLSYFESLYYAHNLDMVYVYNPKNQTIPPYVGLVLIPEQKVIQQIPAKTTAWLIQDNGTYVAIV